MSAFASPDVRRGIISNAKGSVSINVNQINMTDKLSSHHAKMPMIFSSLSKGKANFKDEDLLNSDPDGASQNECASQKKLSV